MSLELIAGYDAWKTRTPYEDEPDHLPDCPMHEDNHDGEPAECTCPTTDELKAAAAEARADLDREDHI